MSSNLIPLDPEHVRNLCDQGIIRRRSKVDSSMVSEIGYDSERRVLEVKFKNNGAVYRYPRIEPSYVLGLLNAQSIGEYFTTYIKERPCCERLAENAGPVVAARNLEVAALLDRLHAIESATPEEVGQIERLHSAKLTRLLIEAGPVIAKEADRDRATLLAIVQRQAGEREFCESWIAIGRAADREWRTLTGRQTSEERSSIRRHAFNTSIGVST